MSYPIRTGPLLFEPGDRLSREEFLERWERMPELKNVELIDGVVYMPSPVSRAHSRFDDRFHLVLSYYAARTLGCECLPNATWLMLESAPQPDDALCILPEYGGRVEERGGFAAGAPELAAEISQSSRSYDLGPKLALYQRAEVREYVAALIEERRIEWDSGAGELSLDGARFGQCLSVASVPRFVGGLGRFLARGCRRSSGSARSRPAVAGARALLGIVAAPPPRLKREVRSRKPEVAQTSFRKDTAIGCRVGKGKKIPGCRCRSLGHFLLRR